MKRWPRRRDHLSLVPYASMNIPRDVLLASDMRDMTYGPCRWCGATHVWSIVDGRFVIDGQERDLGFRESQEKQ